MKDIFANLYNKVVSVFNQTDNETCNGKDVACNRLKLGLMQDRTNLTAAIMDRMRKELIELLSKYVELDKELLDLNFEHEDNQMALMLSIPVIRAKNEEEIQEMIDKEEEEKKLLEEAESEEEDDDETSEENDEDDDTDEDEDDETEDEKIENEIDEEVEEVVEECIKEEIEEEKEKKSSKKSKK